MLVKDIAEFFSRIAMDEATPETVELFEYLDSRSGLATAARRASEAEQSRTSRKRPAPLNLGARAKKSQRKKKKKRTSRKYRKKVNKSKQKKTKKIRRKRKKKRTKRTKRRKTKQ